MKHKLLSLVLAMAAGSWGMAAEIQVGDSLTTVISVLGEPEGYLRAGPQSLLVYERGRVELTDGMVVSVELISPEAAGVRRLERLRQEELARQAAARRAAEGLALRDLKLADPAFLALPASSRVAYWKAFVQSYPGVPVGMEYEVALRELEAEEAALRAEAERAWQWAELERRTAEAEQRAAEAEAQARAQPSYPAFAGYSFTVVSRPSYVIHRPRQPFCPPDPPRRVAKREHTPREISGLSRVKKSPSPLDYSREHRRSGSLHASRR